MNIDHPLLAIEADSSFITGIVLEEAGHTIAGLRLRRDVVQLK
jgi:hypothetical protein